MDQPQGIDILLVEDNLRDVELTLRALKKRNLADHLAVVNDGVEALDFVFNRGQFAHPEARPLPRVVLLDLKLPKVDGLQVLKAIKSDERTRMVPVVVLTSSQQDPDIQTAYALGANSYVVKPVQFEAFQEVMDRLGLYWLLLNQPEP